MKYEIVCGVDTLIEAYACMASDTHSLYVMNLDRFGGSKHDISINKDAKYYKNKQNEYIFCDDLNLSS